jgi:hypothetical protein
METKIKAKSKFKFFNQQLTTKKEIVTMKRPINKISNLAKYATYQCKS